MTARREDLAGTSRSRASEAHNLDFPAVTGVLYGAADLLAAGLGGFIGYELVSGGQPMPTAARLSIVVALLLTRLSFSRWGLYDSWRGRSFIEQVSRLAGGWLTVFVGLVCIAFVLKFTDVLSREWLLTWMAIGGLLLVLARLTATLTLRMLRVQGWNHKRIAVVGNGEWARSVVRRIETSTWLGLDCAVVVTDGRKGQTSLEGIPVVEGLASLPAVIAREKIQEVWICMPIGRATDGAESIERVQHLLRHSTVTQRLVPDLAEMRLINRPVTQILGLPVVSLNVSPMRAPMNRLLKALEDYLLAVVILVLLSPVLLALALGVRLSSPGPVLFKQLRHGWDGKPIRVYKFRTMYVHREEGGTVTQASRNDARVTPFGRFLRQTSLDELPQFFNVLQGRMSIVGPRPHAIEHNHFYMDQIDSYMQRHRVKPGITGWAQVNGYRGETDTLEKMRRRVEHDLYYIDNWSLWFDLRIILLTVVRGFWSPNAY